MATENPQPERRHLGTVLRRPQAGAILADLIRPAAQAELELDGNALTEVDTYGAAILRAGLEAHLARDPSHHVTMVEPRDSNCWAHLSDLLGFNTGQRWAWAATRSPAARGRDVAIPTTLIRDQEDVRLLLDYAIPVIARALSFGDRTVRLLQEAAAVFLENVEQHRRSRAVAPVICVAYNPPSHEVQLVCVNLEQDSSGPPIATLTQLQDAISRSRANHGGLDDLASLKRGGLTFTVRLMSGKARTRRRSVEAWSFFESAESVPAFVAGLEVPR